MNKLTNMNHKIVAAAAFSLLLASCGTQQTANTTETGMNSQESKLKYPETKKVNQTDDYFGTKVSDPYRWLEDDRAEDTKDWVQREVAFTNDYLSKIPFREEIKNQLRDIWNYEKVGAPFKEGEYTYFYKNDGLQAQSVLYRTDKAGKLRFSLIPINFQKKEPHHCRGFHLTKKEI